jgi:hypothetical protein
VDLDEYETAASSMVEAAELAQVNRAELLERLAGVFARCEVWAQAGKYIDGLASDLPRKNGWTLAEQAGDATPDKMQRLLNSKYPAVSMLRTSRRNRLSWIFSASVSVMT